MLLSKGLFAELLLQPYADATDFFLAPSFIGDLGVIIGTAHFVLCCSKSTSNLKKIFADGAFVPVTLLDVQLEVVLVGKILVAVGAFQSFLCHEL